MLPPIVRTQRLVLRRQRPEDAALVMDAVESSLTHLRASVAWAHAELTLAGLQGRLAGTAKAFDAGESWAFSIFDSAETRVLGGAALERAEPALATLVGDDALEVGYWLRADATGRGYATEATAAIVDLAFSSLGARHVAICHDPENVPSAGVPRRLGFTCLGVVPDAKLPGREAPDGSIRPASMVWVTDLGRWTAKGAARDHRAQRVVAH
jgi:RimJ/RimL family protein N-acetyltransferase